MKAFKYLDGNDTTDSKVLITQTESKHATELISLGLMEEIKVEDVSDGYHTFGELYHCRHILFATLCMSHKELAWKSKLHDDGTMFDNFFIAGITTPAGEYTFHIEEEYWNKFDIKEIEKAPAFDGHTLADIEERLLSLVRPIKITLSSTYGKNSTPFTDMDKVTINSINNMK